MQTIIGSQDLIKNINRSLVLETIKNNQPISRAQIAKKLTLSKTTVSVIADDLLTKRMIINLGEKYPNKGSGRPSLMLGFNPSSAYGMGIDIGGTKILIIITDLEGKIVYKNKVKTTNDIEEITNIINQGIEVSGIQRKNIISLGVGVPGTVNAEGKVLCAKALRWNNYYIKSQLEKRLKLPIFVDNDVNLAALGERWLGSGELSNNLFFIAIGTGIGSAIICDGKLIKGYQYRAGEICYTISPEDIAQNRFNHIREKGVFESKVSGTALREMGMTSEDFFRRYKEGKKDAHDIINNFVQELSIVIANAVSLLNPEKVIIGGGVSESMDAVIYDIQENVRKLTPIQTEVVLASLGGRAGAIGAVYYAFDQVEQN